MNFGEMFFFASLCKSLRPSRILIIGNAFGLSSVLLSLLNPAARVVALDRCIEGVDNAEGNRLTERIAKEERLNLRVAIGASPENVPSVVSQYLDNKIDLVFIDGMHTNEQQTVDFEACWAIAGENTFYCLHDVLNYEMQSSFQQICKSHPEMQNALLYRTVSGIGCLYSRKADLSLHEIVNLFTEPADILQRTRREIQVERWLNILPVDVFKRLVPRSAVRWIRKVLYG